MLAIPAFLFFWPVPPLTRAPSLRAASGGDVSVEVEQGDEGELSLGIPQHKPPPLLPFFIRRKGNELEGRKVSLREGV
jgi:hypothetical protein